MSSEVVEVNIEQKESEEHPKYVRFQGKLIPYKKFQRKFAHKPRLHGFLFLNFLFLALLILFAMLITGII